MSEKKPFVLDITGSKKRKREEGEEASSKAQKCSTLVEKHRSVPQKIARIRANRDNLYSFLSSKESKSKFLDEVDSDFTDKTRFLEGLESRKLLEEMLAEYSKSLADLESRRERLSRAYEFAA